jgi:hypothetical protein
MPTALRISASTSGVIVVSDGVLNRPCWIPSKPAIAISSGTDTPAS